ncbi:MAG: glycosyl hydrolase 53 family protein, partial [Bacteroidetes bacterium]|nr:glycosyl hydrolase 53 family protein [Bacteroidota bacterium]
MLLVLNRNNILLPAVMLPLLLLIGACKKPKAGPPLTAKPELMGADLSFLPEVRKSAMSWFNRYGTAEDMLRTLQKSGINLVRLRVWHKPSAGADLQQVQELCRELR